MIKNNILKTFICTAALLSAPTVMTMERGNDKGKALAARLKGGATFAQACVGSNAKGEEAATTIGLPECPADEVEPIVEELTESVLGQPAGGELAAEKRVETWAREQQADTATQDLESATTPTTKHAKKICAPSIFGVAQRWFNHRANAARTALSFGQMGAVSGVGSYSGACQIKNTLILDAIGAEQGEAAVALTQRKNAKKRTTAAIVWTATENAIWVLASPIRCLRGEGITSVFSIFYSIFNFIYIEKNKLRHLADLPENLYRLPASAQSACVSEK